MGSQGEKAPINLYEEWGVEKHVLCVEGRKEVVEFWVLKRACLSRTQ